MKSGCNNKAEESFHINSNRRTAREPAIVFLRPELARFLDDDDQPRRTGRIPKSGFDARRDRRARSSHEAERQSAAASTKDPRPLPNQDRQAWRLSRSREWVAAIADGAAFTKGRDFAAWLGLVPKQISTGDRTILGGISRRGNRYLRTLFIQGTRSVLQRSDGSEKVSAAG